LVNDLIQLLVDRQHIIKYEHVINDVLYSYCIFLLNEHMRSYSEQDSFFAQNLADSSYIIPGPYILLHILCLQLHERERERERERGASNFEVVMFSGGP
jgi:hypothetical protein